MIAGCGHESVQETLEACEYVAALGYDVAMVRTPHFYRAQMTSRRCSTTSRTVADRSPRYCRTALRTSAVHRLRPRPSHLIAIDLPGIATSSASRNPRASGEGQNIWSNSRPTSSSEAQTTHDFQPFTARIERRNSTPPQQNESQPALSGFWSEIPQRRQQCRPRLSPHRLRWSSSMLLRTRRKELGFQTLTGSGGTEVVPMLDAGAVGGILAFPPLATPTVCYKIYAAFNDRNRRQADAQKQQRIEPPASTGRG